MKTILKPMIIILSSIFRGRFAGKLLGFLDFCREVICENENVFAGQIHGRMKLTNILPIKIKQRQRKFFIESTDKIKVRIVYPAGTSWNNIHTLYESFILDDRFQTYILVDNETRFINIMDKVGCKYITLDEYDIRKDRPNIFVATSYSSTEPEISFPGCRDFADRVYAVFPNAVMNEKNKDIHWKYVSDAYKYLKPDFYFCDPLPYEDLKGYIDNKHLIKMGNPQFDEIFREVGRQHPVPETWSKFNDKIVFLWATDHGINESYPKNGFTIDLYLGPMIEYFNNHTELGLIFRPHPEFIREMLKKGKFWTADEVQQIKNYMKNSPNMIWDDTHDYCCSYDTCDALIVDANCSITTTFLATGKPICRLLRYDIQEWLISPSLYDCYYYARGMEECDRFIKDICEGNDPKYEQRQLACKKAILHFDGKNGQRIKDFITSDYLN